MKTLIKIFTVATVIFAGINSISAQTASQDKKAAKAAAISETISDVNFVFMANYANPMRGGQRPLDYGYDLKVTKDTVRAFLPYFGRAYMAPNDPTTNEGGIKFTTTNFSYSSKKNKNGTWSILIKPRDKNATNWRDVQQLTLSISNSGYASLDVISTHRDPISFYGEIEGVKDKTSR